MKDPWGDPRVAASPDSGADPWGQTSAPAGITATRRGHWRPNTAPLVLTACEHLELEWPITRALQKLAPLVYCETCDEWVTYRRATMTEIMRYRQQEELF